MHSTIIYMAWSADTARKCLFIGCLDGGLTVIEHLNVSSCTLLQQDAINTLVLMHFRRKNPPTAQWCQAQKLPFSLLLTHQGTDHIAFAIGSEIHLAKEVTKGQAVPNVTVPINWFCCRQICDIQLSTCPRSASKHFRPRGPKDSWMGYCLRRTRKAVVAYPNHSVVFAHSPTMKRLCWF